MKAVTLRDQSNLEREVVVAVIIAICKADFATSIRIF